MFARPLSRGFQQLIAPRTLITFLIGGLALGVMGNALYDLLGIWFGGDSDLEATTWIFVIGLAFLLISAFVLSKQLRTVEDQEPFGEAPDKRKGLILLVSKEAPCRKAIEWHREKLEWCWLLHSDDEDSKQITELLVEEIRGMGKKAQKKYISNVYDPLKTSEVVNEIYARLPPGLAEEQVILDLTGMTALASMGGLLACMDKQRPIQYVPAIYEGRRVIGSGAPIEIKFRPVQPQVAPATAVTPTPNAGEAS